MQAMDRQYLETPFFGSRRMRVWLERQGMVVGRKRVQRLIRTMGLRVNNQELHTRESTVNQGHPSS